MKRLFRRHQWVSLPDLTGASYFGISGFAKDYFMRLHQADHDRYIKTNYGMKFRYEIDNFLALSRTKKELTLSERMEMDRFIVKQGEGFSLLKTN